MNKNLTEIVFIIDRSGSMRSLEADTIGGFNSFVEQQKKEAGEAVLTTVLFDNKYEILHDRINIQDIKPLTNDEYYSRGLTAMLDAIGKTINDIGNKLRETKEEDRPEKVIFAITTDGQENASVEFNRNQIKEMIQHQQDKYNWKFLFLGANVDAFSEASSIGISRDFSVNYTASTIGTQSLYSSVSKGVSGLRGDAGEIGMDWASDIK